MRQEGIADKDFLTHAVMNNESGDGQCEVTLGSRAYPKQNLLPSAHQGQRPLIAIRKRDIDDRGTARAKPVSVWIQLSSARHIDWRAGVRRLTADPGSKRAAEVYGGIGRRHILVNDICRRAVSPDRAVVNKDGAITY